MKNHLRFFSLLLALFLLLSCVVSLVSCIEKTPEDPPEEAPEPQKPYKDFSLDEPYRITFQTEERPDGPLAVAVVEYNPYYTKPFTLVIPETNDEGAPVDAIESSNMHASVPFYLLEEDYLELLDLMVAKHGMTFEEYDKSDLRTHSMERFRAFYQKFDPTSYEENIKQHIEERFPITKAGVTVYSLDTSATTLDHLWLAALIREQVPDWSDAWAYEKLLKMKELCLENSIEDPNIDEYIKSYSGYGESLTDIQWSTSIKSIGMCCFTGCDALTSMTVPSSIQSVGHCSFAFCENLEDITFSEGVTSIQDETLYGCVNLKTINLPVSLENLNSDLFWYSYEYQDLTLPVINYAGTKEQWKGIIENISGDNYTLSNLINKMTVNCSDGVYAP